VYELTPMSWAHELSATQAALVSAALRHLDDARTLLAASPVQAAYLAGYGPECARKAALMRWPDRDEGVRNRAIGHRFDQPSETALQWFCDLDPLASRYTLLDWRASEPVLNEWREDIRYGRSDSVTVRKARRLLDAAERLTTATVAQLWADGRIDSLGSLVEVKA
jgi:hypothetical protein